MLAVQISWHSRRMPNHRRARIVELLRASPAGLATLALAQQLGAAADSREYRAVIDALNRMVGHGDVLRSSRGARQVDSATVWTLAPHMREGAISPNRSINRRGAAELERARARTAAVLQARSQG